MRLPRTPSASKAAREGTISDKIEATDTTRQFKAPHCFENSLESSVFDFFCVPQDVTLLCVV